MFDGTAKELRKALLKAKTDSERLTIIGLLLVELLAWQEAADL